MPFGKHRGEYLCDIPTSYLRWLVKLENLDDDLRADVQTELESRPPEQRRFVEYDPLPRPIVPPYHDLMRALVRWIEDEVRTAVNDAERRRLIDAKQRLMIRLSETYGLLPPDPDEMSPCND
jgi:Arc/MetJ family transcription regulator